jgi:hypothetical protein
MNEQPQTCEWYLMCTNTANGYVFHPVLGPVPTCLRCKDRHEMDFMTADELTGAGARMG